jgi:glycerol-3-phosphate dehydrogenase (NAD(P)+)
VALDSVAAEQDFILFCLPANPHFELASRLRPRLRRDGVCLSVAKGLDEHGRTAAQALTEALGSVSAFGVLYGPMISEEIRDGRPAFAQAGTTHAETYGRVRELFAETSLSLEHSTDIAGISWSAVLKNVYAILFGVADEMGMGDNTRGYLAVAAVAELESIVTGLGGDPETPRRLAGLGDLITTATSPGSHHHEVGRRLARGQEALTGEVTRWRWSTLTDCSTLAAFPSSISSAGCSPNPPRHEHRCKIFSIVCAAEDRRRRYFFLILSFHA